ncbi:MAG TPA: DUF5683 domain-containing protein [Chitinophagaceae bacterium]|nr:DUF5683 domain-containing protein [Chitinophagaceae bacterium]
MGIFFGLQTFSKAHTQTVIDSTGRKIDSTTIRDAAIDSVNNIRSPHKASIRSAIFPGLGQIYNKSYWKLPIVYGALGTTAYVFFDNLKTYKELRFAYAARYEAALPPNTTVDYPGPYQDSTKYKTLKSIYQNPNLNINSIKQSRDEFRRYVDYSVLVFAVFWALNIIDASVDAHLKSFDVSPDLGLRFKAGYNDMARTSGVGLVLYLK